MDSPKVKRILEQIAQKEHTTAAEVRREIMEALAEAQRSPDPAVQARWAAVPRRGKEPTLDEIVDYLAKQVR